MRWYCELINHIEYKSIKKFKYCLKYWEKANKFAHLAAAIMEDDWNHKCHVIFRINYIN